MVQVVDTTEAMPQVQVRQVKETQAAAAAPHLVAAVRAKRVTPTQTATVVTEPRAMGSRIRSERMRVVEAQEHWTRALRVTVVAVRVLRRLLVRAVYRTRVAAVVVETTLLVCWRVVLAVRALSSSDTRWPHNG